ncbi:potassium channel subfamily K member 10b isoform X1 [Tachysurus ichikawai]
MKFSVENPRKQVNWNPEQVVVQTNMAPPKKLQPGVIQSSLVQASLAAMQNPMGCEVKANEHCPLPRLSISSRSASIVASMDAVADGSAIHYVMKCKTVLAVFVAVVLYLVVGGLVFQALEQPFESDQKNTITQKKALFLQGNPCVSPAELEDLIKVSTSSGSCSKHFHMKMTN